MEPQIESTSFGSITVAGQKIKGDIVLTPDGSIKKRKKKLSKRIYGSSHTISLDEAKHIYQKGVRLLIIGTGQYDMVRLSDEARAYLEKHGCQVQLAATPEAIRLWNDAQGQVIGLFHVTC